MNVRLVALSAQKDATNVKTIEIMPNLLKIKDVVEKLLRTKKHLRDDNNRLIANIWLQESKKLSPIPVTAHDMLEAVSKGKFTLSDSITRVSRKLQQEYPELRGENWNERHGLQDDVNDQLNLM